jgi:ADP-ribose pyrophosphatase YjhB (NUDIX family)
VQHDILHRLKVFVYRVERAEPTYLLVRSAQGVESSWGPLQGNLGFGEKLEGAIRREVLEDVGIARAQDVIDLRLINRWDIGDEQVIEWNYALRALHPVEGLRLDARLSEFRWMAFGDAYPNLVLDHDRAAILRLHTLLGRN